MLILLVDRSILEQKRGQEDQDSCADHKAEDGSDQTGSSGNTHFSGTAAEQRKKDTEASEKRRKTADHKDKGTDTEDHRGYRHSGGAGFFVPLRLLIRVLLIGILRILPVRILVIGILLIRILLIRILWVLLI